VTAPARATARARATIHDRVFFSAGERKPSLPYSALVIEPLQGMPAGTIGWLGRVKMRGRSGVELDLQFAIHTAIRNGKFTSIHTFLSWQEGRDVAGLPNG
jgi:hypothetical protein